MFYLPPIFVCFCFFFFGASIAFDFTKLAAYNFVADVYKGYRYTHVRTRMTYDDARENCESQRAYLASVYSAEDNELLFDFTVYDYLFEVEWVYHG